MASSAYFSEYKVAHDTTSECRWNSDSAGRPNIVSVTLVSGVRRGDDMIHLAKKDYSIICRNGIWYIIGNDKTCCPVCGGELRVRGICHRKMRTFRRILTLRLRVLMCQKCGKTHRELPHFLIPHKRYGLRCVIEILTAAENTYPCETSTRRRIRKWWEKFCAHVEHHTMFQRFSAYHPRDADCTLARKLLLYVHWSVKMNL